MEKDGINGSVLQPDVDKAEELKNKANQYFKGLEKTLAS